MLKLILAALLSSIVGFAASQPSPGELTGLRRETNGFLDLSQKPSLVSLFDAGLRPFQDPGTEVMSGVTQEAQIGLRFGKARIGKFKAEWIRFRVAANDRLMSFLLQSESESVMEICEEVSPLAELMGVSRKRVSQFCERTQNSKDVATFRIESGLDEGVACELQIHIVPSNKTIHSYFTMNFQFQIPREEANVRDVPIISPVGYESHDMSSQRYLKLELERIAKRAASSAAALEPSEPMRRIDTISSGVPGDSRAGPNKTVQPRIKSDSEICQRWRYSLTVFALLMGVGFALRHKWRS